MRVIYGYDIPKEYYEKIADFDAEIFSADAEDFADDTTMPRESMLSMFNKNMLTTILVLDDNEEIIGYYQTFPLEPEFEKRYLHGEASFKEIDGSKILPGGEKSINLYLWSLGVKQNYRGVKIPDPKDPKTMVSVNQLLHEGLVDAITDLKKSGTTIDYIFGEAVSAKGVETMERFCGKDSLIHADDEKEFYMYGSKFNPECQAFARCRNVQRLKEAYMDKQAQTDVLAENYDKLASDSNQKQNSNTTSLK